MSDCTPTKLDAVSLGHCREPGAGGLEAAGGLNAPVLLIQEFDIFKGINYSVTEPL